MWAKYCNVPKIAERWIERNEAKPPPTLGPAMVRMPERVYATCAFSSPSVIRTRSKADGACAKPGGKPTGAPELGPPWEPLLSQ